MAPDFHKLSLVLDVVSFYQTSTGALPHSSSASFYGFTRRIISGKKKDSEVSEVNRVKSDRRGNDRRKADHQTNDESDAYFERRAGGPRRTKKRRENGAKTGTPD